MAVATDSIDPGPVHINAAFDEPLVDESVTKELPPELAGRPGGRPWTADARLVAGMSIQVDEVLALLDETAVVPARGLIVVGDHDDDDAVVMTSFTTFWRVICDNFVREKTFYLLSCDFLLFSVYIFSYRSTTKLHLYAFMNHPSNHKSLVKS